MEIGSVSDIGRLEHILLPDPRSYWISETRHVKYEGGVRKERVLHSKRRGFGFLDDIVSRLDFHLKQEGIRVSYLYFYPSGSVYKAEEGGDRIVVACDPSYLSYCIRDYGIFTKKRFLYGARAEFYGDVPERFAKKLEQSVIRTIRTGI